VRVVADGDVQVPAPRQQPIDGVASLRLVWPAVRRVDVVGLDRVQIVRGEAVEVQEVRQPRMQKHVVGAGLRGPASTRDQRSHGAELPPTRARFAETSTSRDHHGAMRVWTTTYSEELGRSPVGVHGSSSGLRIRA
jgi:hypothetical protein